MRGRARRTGYEEWVHWFDWWVGWVSHFTFGRGKGEKEEGDISLPMRPPNFLPKRPGIFLAVWRFFEGVDNLWGAVGG